jgi:hypothetical protein
MDGGQQEWCFTGRFPLKLHREFVLQGYCGCNVRVVVCREVLYLGLTVHTIDS